MPRQSALAAVALLALVATAGTAQDGSLRFERTVAFDRGQTISLGARIGPVRVANVRFGVEEGGGSGGGIRDSILSRVPGRDPETTSVVTASFDTENPTEDEWEVTYTLDFLDRNGKLIDRGSDKEGFEGEAASHTVSHSTLKYVVPSIARVRIRLEAKYD
jgi:hypothetical protein